MYEVKRTILPPSETKFPWHEMQPMDHFDCDIVELPSLKESIKRMSQKFYGFQVEIARYGDTLTVWLIKKGEECVIDAKIEQRILNLLSKKREYVSNGVIINRIKGASTKTVKECLNALILKKLIVEKKEIHPKQQIEFVKYRIA